MVRRWIHVLVLLVCVGAGVAKWWIDHDLTLAAPVLDLAIEPGISPRRVAQTAVQSGVSTSAVALYWWFRLSGQARQIKAGSYELAAGLTPRSLLSKLVRGEESLRAVALTDGLTFAQCRMALAKADQLAQDTQGLPSEVIMARLGRPGAYPEGRFFPDTYTYSKGSSDLSVLKRAMRAMDRHLTAAWQQRDPGLPLSSPDDALILASIIEKETGRASDRAMISAVFLNRLRAGMLLQTDPTVIYGMGDQFDGNLRRRDLQTDTPWNTYTRAGLPPTPIAMPGQAALLAAVHPTDSQALYFVARGDGSSQFSTTLSEHNRAVDLYQRTLKHVQKPLTYGPTP